MGSPDPKSKPKFVPREPLQIDPPAELRLTGRAKSIYRSIAGRVAAEGFASKADARTVALAAQATALAERMEAELVVLPSLMAGDKPHPFLIELRQLRGQIQTCLGALLMTPKSRASARIAEGQFRAAPTWGNDEGRFSRDPDETDDDVMMRLPG